MGKLPRHYFDLNVMGMAEHRRLAREMDGSDWYHTGGNLEWTQADVEILTDKVDQLRGWEYPVEWVDRATLNDLVPGVAAAEVQRAAFYRDDAFVDAVPLVRGLLETSSRIRVWSRSRVARLEHRPGQSVGLVTDDGRRVTADRVVMCAGPQSSEVVRLAGFELPMRESTGLIAVTEPAPVLLERVLHAPGIAIRPDGAGRLMLQSEGLDRQLAANGGSLEIAIALETLAARAIDVLPALSGTRIESYRLGARALTADGLPAVGPLGELEAVYLAVSHSGITLAPLIGRLVAGELAGGGESEQLAPYRPHRFMVGGPESV